MAKTGTIFVHGGASTGPDVIKAFIQAAGGVEMPLVVLAQTSEDPNQKGQISADWLRENGAKVVTAPGYARPDAAGVETLLALLARAGGVWIPGGDQNRWMQAFSGTPILAAVQKVYERGGAVGGTSAGASLMGQIMPTGEGEKTVMHAGAVATATGANLLEKTMVDSHFFARERVQRLVNMVVTQPEFVGLGVDEKAWATINRGRVTVHSGQAMLIRATGPTTRDDQKRLGAKEVRLQILLPQETASLR